MDTLTTLILALRAVMGALSLAENAAPITLGDEPGLCAQVNYLLHALDYEGALLTRTDTPTTAWLALERAVKAHPGIHMDRTVAEALA